MSRENQKNIAVLDGKLSVLLTINIIEFLGFIVVLLTLILR